MPNAIHASSSPDAHPSTPLKRRAFARLAIGGAAVLALSACGGGGGGGDSSDGDLDLRAAYDRIVEGMDHEDVDRAVGTKSKSPNNITRQWDSGNQSLWVGFAELRSGTWTVASVQWKVVAGGNLTKTFDPNTYK